MQKAMFKNGSNVLVLCLETLYFHDITSPPPLPTYITQWVIKKACARKSGSFVRLWSSVDPLPSSAPPLRPMMSMHQTVHPFLFTSATPTQPPPSSFFLHYTFNSPPHTNTTLPPLTYPHLFVLPSYPFACTTHPFHPLSVRNPLFTSYSLPPPHSIISPHMSASSLFFVTHFPHPTFFSTLQ